MDMPVASKFSQSPLFLIRAKWKCEALQPRFCSFWLRGLASGTFRLTAFSLCARKTMTGAEVYMACHKDYGSCDSNVRGTFVSHFFLFPLAVQILNNHFIIPHV